MTWGLPEGVLMFASYPVVLDTGVFRRRWAAIPGCKVCFWRAVSGQV